MKRRRHDLVRSFVLTGGRAKPSQNTRALDIVTAVTAVSGMPLGGLQPEHLAIVELCRGGHLSLVEVASHLEQPLTITRVFLGDLLESGHLVISGVCAGSTDDPAGEAMPEAVHLDILERMLRGLQAL